MKIKTLVTLIAVLTFTSSFVFSQAVCKVLLPAISDSYTGTCKQGLADGKGEALGVDQYKGDFKKGLPDGIGTYVWQAGHKYEGQWKKGLREGKGTYTMKYQGRDSVLAGVWKEDKYLGEEVLPPYLVEYRSGIGRVSCMRMGDKPWYVKYKFSRSGESADLVSELIMQGSTGTESVTYSFTGFENVTFPFSGKVKFDAPNALNTAILHYETRLTINQPGAWVVTIYY